MLTNQMQNASRSAIVPVLKMSEKLTYSAALNSNAPFVVIKLQEFMNSRGTEFNKLYRDTIAVGGLHAYLKYTGKILLSLIMPNKMIRNCTPEKYAEAIKNLCPNYVTTVDGETYEDRIITAPKECDRCLKESTEIMRLCPNQEFFGLIKGASILQVEHYTEELADKGIKTFIFHVGDFVFRGNSLAKLNAVAYVRKIRKIVPKLILYGISSPTHLNKFPRAEVYVTQTHYISAFKGLVRTNGKWKKIQQTSLSEIIQKNLFEIIEEANKIFAPQGGLLLWVADTTTVAEAMQVPYMVSIMPKSTAMPH